MTALANHGASHEMPVDIKIVSGWARRLIEETEGLTGPGWHERAFVMAARASSELQDGPLLAEALCLAGQSAHLADARF